MSLTINTNLNSIRAQRHLTLSQSGLATSMQRLSSGLRVNSAKDDAAGLAISERMHAQIRGMNQAARNANDAISLMQTAEGAASKLTDMMQRMRELAVQSINDTNSDNDRKALQSEVAQLKQEIDRVGTTTKFNGLYVFDPSRKPAAGGDPDAEALMAKLKGGWLGQVEKVVNAGFGINASPVLNMPVNLTTFTDGAGNFAAAVQSGTINGQGPAVSVELVIDMADFAGLGDDEALEILAHEMVHAVMARGASWSFIRSEKWFVEGTAEFIYGADQRVANHGWDNTRNQDIFSGWGSSSEEYAGGYVAVRSLHEAIKTATGGTKDMTDLLQALQTTSYASLDAALQDVTAGATPLSLATFQSAHNAIRAGAAPPAWLDLNNSDSGSVIGSDAGGSADVTSAAAVAATGGDMVGFNAIWEDLPSGSSGWANQLGFQVGANAGDFVYSRIGAMNLGALGLEKLDISTSSGATSALGLLDKAIDYVSSQRGDMGALMSRFESIIATLQIGSENLSASRGRIVDADYATETASLARTQILQQAGTAMVAQANHSPQIVLSLLR